jgi:hypothetical protein
MSSHKERAARYGLPENVLPGVVNDAVRVHNVLIRAGKASPSLPEGFSAMQRNDGRLRGFDRGEVAAALGVSASSSDVELLTACRVAQRTAEQVRAAATKRRQATARAAVASAAAPVGAPRQFETAAGVAQYGCADTDAIAAAKSGISTSLLSRAQKQALVDRGLLTAEAVPSATAGVPFLVDGNEAA